MTTTREAYRVTVSKGTNTYSVSGGGWYNKGATVTLAADTPTSVQSGSYSYSPASAASAPTNGATRWFNVTNYNAPTWSRTGSYGSVTNTRAQSTTSARAGSKLTITNLSTPITATATTTTSASKTGQQTYMVRTPTFLSANYDLWNPDDHRGTIVAGQSAGDSKAGCSLATSYVYVHCNGGAEYSGDFRVHYCSVLVSYKYPDGSTGSFEYSTPKNGTSDSKYIYAASYGKSGWE